MKSFERVAKAVSLLAAAGMSRTKGPLEAAKAYSDRLSRMMRTLLSPEGFAAHIASLRQQQRSALVIVLGADKGLCGGYHSNLTKIAGPHIQTLRQEIPDVHVEVFGKRTGRLMRAQKMEPEAVYERGPKTPTLSGVLPDADRYWNAFQKGEVDRVDIAYTHYDNATAIKPEIATLLPVQPVFDQEDNQDDPSGRMDFLPSREDLLTEMLLPYYQARFYQLFLEATLCEQKARMERMSAAKTSAKKRGEKYGRQYRRARQGKITGELQELTGGADAVNEQ